MDEYAPKFAMKASWTIMVLCCGFLFAPIVAIIPLSFNSVGAFSYPMPGLSLRWYDELITSDTWMTALGNSLIVALGASVVATVAGTVAALGLARLGKTARALFSGFLISPIIVPPVVIAVGAYLLFAKIHLTASLFGIILAHATLGIPTVIITVGAAFAGFDRNLIRAAASLGANPGKAFFRVIMPLLMPALLSGAIFAFVASLDEFIVTSFLAGPEQVTLPLQMWTGIREDVTPIIMAAATTMIVISTAAMGGVYALRQISRRMSAEQPQLKPLS